MRSSIWIWGPAFPVSRLKVHDVFNARQALVRDAGEVTNSYVYIKSWIGTYVYVSRPSDDSRHYVSGDDSGDRRDAILISFPP